MDLKGTPAELESSGRHHKVVANHAQASFRIVDHCNLCPKKPKGKKKYNDYFLKGPASTAFKPNKLSSLRPSFNCWAFLTGRGEHKDTGIYSKKKGVIKLYNGA